MGQSAQANNINSQEDLFLRELKVYQWRADSNYNLFIPRVFFKSLFAKLQQQQLTKFIQQQENSQYFQVSKFRERIQQVPKNADDQLIIFQNYQCTLKELQGKLSFQSALYVLQALLAGYEQIKKVYQTIIIDSRCCFVTSQGSIRAWINPNSKNNRLWNEKDGETIRHNIIYKIVRMVQLSTQTLKRSEYFFSNLFFNLTHAQMNCSYSELRRWINEYCFTHNIIMSKKIELNTKNNEKRKNSQKHQGHSRKTVFSERQQCYKEKNPLFLSTQQTEYNNPFHRVRSLQKNIAQTSAVFEARNTNLQQQIGQISIPSHYKLQNSTSQIFIRPKEELQPIKISTTIQTTPQSNIVNENQLMLSQAQNLNQDKKRLMLGSSKQLELISKQSSQSRRVKLQKEEREVKVQKKSSLIKVGRPRDEKKTKQLSIMQNIVDNIKQNRHRSYAEKEYSQTESNSQSLSNSRPWITTKTITKLISDNQEKYSVKNSIAQSSDYYNGSVYSGVLTQMGRDVPKPINLGRSKTVGISQQL